VDAKKGLLNDLAGVLLIPEQTQGDGKGSPLMTLHQLFEGEFVAFLGAFNEGTILFRFELTALSVGRPGARNIHPHDISISAF